MRPKQIALVTVLVVITSLWSTIAFSESADITVNLNRITGSPGQIRKVPIYISNLDDFDATEISLEVKYDRRILRFNRIYTEDDTLVWDSDIYIEEFLRESLIKLRFSNDNYIDGVGKIVDLEFEVIGPKGAAGQVEIQNFVITSPVTPTVVVHSSEFRVLPMVEYLSDRDVIEITAGEVFTTFKLEFAGEIGLVTGYDDSSWEFVLEDDQMIGNSGSSYGVTYLRVPVLPDISDLKIFSLTLGEEDEIHFLKRDLFIPVAAK